MGGNYEKGIYNQLMDVMVRFEAVDQKYEYKILKIERKYECQIAGIRADAEKKFRRLQAEVCVLEKENKQLKEENGFLTDEVARLKSILNNDSSNTSSPPSIDRKLPANTKRANEYNGRGCTKRHAGVQKGHKSGSMPARTGSS